MLQIPSEWMKFCRKPWFSRFCTGLLIGLLLVPQGAWAIQSLVEDDDEPTRSTKSAPKQTDSGTDLTNGDDIAGAGVATYERKSVTYFPMDDDVVKKSRYDRAVKAARKAVEIGRFDINEVPVPAGSTVQDLAELVRDYVDYIKVERARGQAEYDFRFKEQVITAELLQQIADSAFIYQPYISRVYTKHVDFTITNPLPSYVVKVEGGVRLWKVDFETGDLKKIAKIMVKTEGSANSETRSKFDAQQLAYDEALEWFTRELSAELRNLDEFKIKANIIRADVDTAYIPLTKEDGIPVDTYFGVYETLSDGTREQVGWIKTRDIGDGVEQSQSTAQVISVFGTALKLQGGEELEELSQANAQWIGRAGIALMSVTDTVSGLEGNDAGGFYISAERQWSIAEKTGINELYLGGRGSVVMPLPYLEANFEVLVFKRFYLRRVILGIGAAAGVYGMLVPGADRAIANFDSAYSFGAGVRPEADIEIWFSPSFHLNVYLSMRAYSPNLGLFDQDGNAVENRNGDLVDYDDFQYLPLGPTAAVGFNYAF